MKTAASAVLSLGVDFLAPWPHCVTSLVPFRRNASRIRLWRVFSGFLVGCRALPARRASKGSSLAERWRWIPSLARRAGIVIPFVAGR
jgi:hypothetical protein